MFSWFKRGGQDEYEPLNPLPSPPRRGQTQMLKYAVISGVACLLVTAVLVVVILDGTSSSATPVVVQKNISPYLLAAAGDQLLADGNETVVPAAQPLVDGNDTVVPANQPDGKETVPGDTTPTKGVTELGQVAEDILVALDQGILRGMKLKSRAGRDYLTFLGIPYAKPPLGDLRFKPPVEAEPWEGTLNATVLTSECIQKDKYNLDLVVKGDEDCLYLNIYTPKNFSDLGSRRNRYPVMLYIHGGGPYGNASRYRADYLMDENVVFVTVHYRLGVLGNLNTNDSAARGNQGLKDQVMAMQWIKDNIRNFGGNPRKVTLFGNSYGGMEVHAHVFSPMSKGLFHRAICQSGVLLFPGSVNENPANTTLTLAAGLNCTRTNSSELVDCLRLVSASDIIKASYLDDFVISIEPPSENDNEDTILPGHPLKLLESGDINRVPVIFGVNSGEALLSSLAFLVTSNFTNFVNEHFNQVLGPSLMLDVNAANPNAILDSVRQFYLGTQNVSRETQGNFTNIFTDRNYIHPTTVAANFQADNNGRRNKVFLYYFNWEVPQKYSRSVEAVYKPTEFLGASHADELQMLFPYDDFPYISLDSVHANMSQTMVKLWATFAADGKPSGTTADWLPIAANDKPFQFFELNSNSFKMVDPVGERMKFWDGFNLTDLYEVNSPLGTL